MKLIIFGHSHVWALRRALAVAAPGDWPGTAKLVIALCGTREFPADLVYRDGRGRRLLNSALLSGLSRCEGDPRTDVLVSCVQGNQYNDLGLLTDAVPFDMHVPGWPRPPDASLPLVPYRAIRDMMGEQLAEFPQFLARLKSLRYQGIAHVCPPPPIPDAAFVSAALPPLPSGGNAEVSSADVRLKLWSIQRQITKKMAEEAGAVFFDPPEGTCDKDGFLARPFWKDSVHANADYGRLALTDLARATSRLSGQKSAA